ncbi:MAG: polyketide synthase dehydratase domain-containing protein [Candidatus Riflebacteria bacterium]|nr:polyketide synthase dehydratase domain-containing protein [Candidatus Riflebacteria bacterium]
MDRKTVAVTGAAMRLDGLPLRDCWSGPLGGGPGVAARPGPGSGGDPLTEVVRQALVEGGARGAFAQHQVIGIACAGSRAEAGAGVASELGLDGPVTSGTDPLELLTEATNALIGWRCDAVVLCAGDGQDAAAVLLRRYREAWRLGYPLLALVRQCGEVARLAGSTTMLELAGPERRAEVPGSGEVDACWVGAWNRGGPVSWLASLLRVVLALHDRILPRSFLDASALPPGRHFVTDAPRPWFQGNERRPRRGAVVSGRRAALLEEPPRSLLDRVRRVAHVWPSELFLFAADDRATLLSRVDEVKRLLAEPADRSPALSDVAGTLAAAGLDRRCRLAVIASGKAELSERLDTVQRRLADPATRRLRIPSAVYYGEGWDNEEPVALLFPGNGSQYIGMLEDVCLAVSSVQNWLDYFDENLTEAGLVPSQVFFPVQGLTLDADSAPVRRLKTVAETGGQAIVMASLALHELLTELSVPHTLTAGFSIGELAALVAAGVLRLGQSQEILRITSDLTRERTPGGRSLFPLLVVQTGDRGLIDDVMKSAKEPLFVALDCCPSQVVLCGSQAAVASAEERLQASGATVFMMPWDRGYHTPMFAVKAEKLREVYESIDAGPGRVPVVSTVSLEPYPDDAPSIRRMSMAQWTNTVRFRELVLEFYEKGIRTFVEVGPSNRLSGFVRDCLRGRKHTALASNVEGRSGILQLLELFAHLYSVNRGMDARPFFACRRLETVPALAPQEPEAADEPGPPVAGSAGPSHPQDGRAAVLAGHLDLMNVFLASQQRVHSMLFGRPLPAEATAEATVAPAAAEPGEHRPSAPPAPATTGPRWPLLIPVPAHDGTSLTLEMTMDEDTLPVLGDHHLGGRPSTRRPELKSLSIVPFALAVELMAQAAECLGAPLLAVQIENVRALRWLALDGGSLKLGVEARRVGPDVVETQLWQLADDDSEPRALAYSAQVRLSGSLPPPRRATIPLAPPRQLVFSASEFYGFMFHGPSLRAIQRVEGMGPDGAVARLVVPPRDRMVRSVRSPRFCTEPVLQDNTGQLVGYWLFEHFRYVDIGLYPFRMKRCVRFAENALAVGAGVGLRAVLHHSGRRTAADFELIDPSGNLLVRVDGFESRLFHLPQRLYEMVFCLDDESRVSDDESQGLPDGVRLRLADALPSDFMEQSWGIWQRVLAHIVLGAVERDEWARVGLDRRLPWLLSRIAAKEAVRDWAAGHDVALQHPDVEIAVRSEGGAEPVCRELTYVGAVPSLDLDGHGSVGVAVLGPAGTGVGVALVVHGQEEDAVRRAAARATGGCSLEILERSPEGRRVRLAPRSGEVVIEVESRRVHDSQVAVCTVGAEALAALAALAGPGVVTGRRP